MPIHILPSKLVTCLAPRQGVVPLRCVEGASDPGRKCEPRAGKRSWPLEQVRSPRLVAGEDLQQIQNQVDPPVLRDAGNAPDAHALRVVDCHYPREAPLDRGPDGVQRPYVIVRPPRGQVLGVEEYVVAKLFHGL